MDGELLDGVRERSVQHIKRLPCEHVLQPLLPPVERGGRDVGRIGAIYELVGAAAPDCKEEKSIMKSCN